MVLADLMAIVVVAASVVLADEVADQVAVLAEDAELFLPYFDMMYYGRDGASGTADSVRSAGVDMEMLQTSVFAGQE